MFKSIIDDIKASFRSGNMITRLIMVNCIVFVCVVLCRVFNYNWQTRSVGRFYEWLVHDNLALSSSIKEVLFHPWSLVSHMFLHEGAWHLAWNMLWLYWMGRILGDLIGDKKILPIYLLGGLFGASVYLLFAMLVPGVAGPYALGASAAVSAITLAAAATSPNYSMRFLIVGNVKLKYVALVVVVLDLLYSTYSNTGGHFAHLGGAFFGWLSVASMRNGYSLTAPLERLLDRRNNVSKPKSKLKVAHKSSLLKSKSEKPSPKQDKDLVEVDKILEKIKANGFDSLSENEKRILDKASKE